MEDKIKISMKVYIPYKVNTTLNVTESINIM